MPFEEYVKFVKFCIRNKLSVLTFSLPMYAKNIYNDQMLVRLYFLDMSEIILVELYKAVTNQRECINVRHIFEDIRVVAPISKCAAMFNRLEETYRQQGVNACSKYTQNGLQVSQLTAEEKDVLCYGLYLRALSFKKDANKFNVGG